MKRKPNSRPPVTGKVLRGLQEVFFTNPDIVHALARHPMTVKLVGEIADEDPVIIPPPLSDAFAAQRWVQAMVEYREKQKKARKS